MDFSKMTVNELVQLQGKIGTEIQMRRESEFNEAVEQLKTAFDNFKEKFPYATWNITAEDCDGLDYTIDLMEIKTSLFEDIYR